MHAGLVIIVDGGRAILQANRGFATSQLCTDEDGTRYFSRYIFYMVRIGTSKKGGNAPRATDKKSM